MTRRKASTTADDETAKPVGLRALLWALLNESRNHLVLFHDNHRRRETVVAMTSTEKTRLVAALTTMFEAGTAPWSEEELVAKLRHLESRWPTNLAIVHVGGSGLSVRRRPDVSIGDDVAGWPEVCRLHVPGNSCA